jgi:hypothetical protein
VPPANGADPRPPPLQPSLDDGGVGDLDAGVGGDPLGGQQPIDVGEDLVTFVWPDLGDRNDRQRLPRARAAQVGHAHLVGVGARGGEPHPRIGGVERLVGEHVVGERHRIDVRGVEEGDPQRQRRADRQPKLPASQLGFDRRLELPAIQLGFDRPGASQLGFDRRLELPASQLGLDRRLESVVDRHPDEVRKDAFVHEPGPVIGMADERRDARGRAHDAGVRHDPFGEGVDGGRLAGATPATDHHQQWGAGLRRTRLDAAQQPNEAVTLRPQVADGRTAEREAQRGEVGGELLEPPAARVAHLVTPDVEADRRYSSRGASR